MNQKIVQELADEIAIYAYRLSVSQADLPYVAEPPARPASTKKFSLYADEITIVGDLINPGQGIKLVARAMHLNQPTLIDCGGASASRSYAPGQLPTQNNTAFGASGANGADASAPGPAGDLSLAAAIIDILGSAPTSTTVAPIDAWMTSALASAPVPQQLSAALTNLPFAFQVDAADVQGLNMTGALDVSGAVLVGADSFQVRHAAIDPISKEWLVDLCFPALTLSGSVNISLAGVDLVMGEPLSSSTFTAALRLRVGVASPLLTLRDGQRVSISADINTTLLSQQAAPLSASSNAMLSSALLTTLAGKLSPILGAIASGRATVPLTLLAQGSTGGRGQDGQDGIAGKPGVAGFTPAGSAPGLVDNGILISYPAAAAGTAGSPGGQAGSAGHSTAAGAAGTVSTTLGGGNIAQILVSAAAGQGGDRAAPGKIGTGGVGGQGSDILVYVAGDPPGIVHDWTAPSGANGTAGAAAGYGGADGADGTPGVARCNSVVLQGATPIAPQPAALALLVPLTQLLICEQCNAVDHLNARVAGDFAPVVARYQWMVAITEPFSDNADPSNGAFTATDLAVRRAINQSCKLELARIALGLDYYGNVVNWVPVLSMAALKGRVADLLAIGKTVEDTFNSYVAATSSTATQLSLLDSTLNLLRNKITADQAAIAQLDLDLVDAEAQVKASLAPISAQQNRLAVDEYEFKQEFIAYVLTQATDCSFIRVLELIVCIVEFAAEAVVGLGEISELTEAGTVYGFASGLVKVIKTAEAEIEAIRKAIDSVQSLLDTDIDMAKVVVDEKAFDDFIGQYLGKFPAASELANAVHQYFALIEAHNKLALAYTGMALRRARLQTAMLKHQSQVESVAALRAQTQANAILPEYTAFMTSAYWDLKGDLLRELFEFNRAYTYWSLIERPFVASDETIANLAVTYAAWSTDIDTYLEMTGPVQPFTQKIDISIVDYPEAFALLARTRTLNVRLDLATLVPRYFASMTHIVATSLTVALPDIHPSSGTLLIELSHSGLSAQNSGDPATPGNIHVYSHARRTIPFKIDYGNPANTAGGVIGDKDQGFPGLSPFTMWHISFDQPGNEWLDVSLIKTISLTLVGTFLLS